MIRKIVVIMMLVGLSVVPTLTLAKAPDISSLELQLQIESEANDNDNGEGSQETPHIDLGGVENAVATLGNKISSYFTNANKYAKKVTYSTYSGGYAASDISSARVLVIGDSVTLGAVSTLKSMIPGVYVDAKGSRGIETAVGLLNSYKAKSGGKLPGIIVISLVTNYRTITVATWDAIVAAGGQDKKYVLVTGYCGNANCTSPATNRAAQNNSIYNYAASHSNVYVADWFTMALNDRSLTGADNTHIGGIRAGMNAYAGLIAGKVNNL